MKVNVLFFGPLADLTGCRQLIVADVNNTGELNAKLMDEYPGLKGSKYAIAVEKKIVKTDTRLSDNATVAFLPPFSGG